MTPRKLSRRTSRHVEVDCAECLSARRCWDGPELSVADITVRPQEPFAKGASLFRQGEPFNAAYVLVRGCFCLRETLPDGVDRVVGFRLPGDVIGLEGWTLGRYPYTAEAADSSKVCQLPLPRTPQSTGASNALLQRLLSKSVLQLDRATRPWTGLPAVERVAEFLRDFARHAQADSSGRDSIHLPMTRAQLGSYLGLAEETVVRALAELRRRRRLDIEGRAMSIRAASTAPSPHEPLYWTP